MSKRNYDDEPMNPSTEEAGQADPCTGCGPKCEPCVCKPEPDPSPTSDSPASNRKLDLEARRRDLEELDGILCRTLLSIVKSGKATPSHINAACQYLKMKGYTLPEMAKRERMAEDNELLGDIDLPFNA